MCMEENWSEPGLLKSDNRTKPVLNIRVNLNVKVQPEFRKVLLDRLRAFGDKLSDSYEVIITPKEADVEIQSNNGFNAVNLYLGDTCDFEKLHEFLIKYSEGG